MCVCSLVCLDTFASGSHPGGIIASIVAYLNGPDFIVVGEQGRSIKSFDKTRQVYAKADLSPIPFKPPAYYSFLTAMLAGAFKVFQYVITIMVALMVTQHSVERYWSVKPGIASWQSIMYAIFIIYPMLTLMLIVITNNEMAVRKFMYYRLMSLQVIVDFENTPFWRMWFFLYFVVSFALINLYSLWAVWLTKDDKTTSVAPQWSIMAMQSVLLLMFWLGIVGMEEQLVPLNKVIENSPESAKELIQTCDVITEPQLKAVIKDVYRRLRAFKQLTSDVQDVEGRKLLQQGNSAAAFFDLIRLRSKNKRQTQEAQVVIDVAPEAGPGTAGPGCNACWNSWVRAATYLDELLWHKSYAYNFALAFLSFSMFRLHRSRRPRAAASLWPYPGDTAYFIGMAIVGMMCTLSIVAAEVYAIWYLLFAQDVSDRDTYGILGERGCN
eukprot:gene1342-1685_t